MADDRLELVVHNFNDPKTRRDYLPRRSVPKFLDELKNVGAGEFNLFAQDVALLADADLLHYGNVVKALLNGKAIGAFVIQNRKEVYISAEEDAGKQIAVSGEGLKTWFKDGLVYPEGGLRAQAGESRSFSFASQRGSWYNAAEWKTPVTVYQYEMIPARGSTNPWKYQPAEWPDAPKAKWVWSQKNPTKPYTVPAGYNYFRYEFETTTAGTYSVFAAGDNTLQVFVDAESVIESEGTQAFIQTYRADVELNPGKHVVAYKVRNTSGPGGLISSVWRAGDAEAEIPAQMITYTGLVNGWSVNGYPATEPGWTVGQILLTLMDEAQARGVLFPTWVTPRFTATTDSAGVAWDRSLPWSFAVGSTYLDVIEALEELACDVWIDPETYEMYVWASRGTNRSFQSSTGEPIQFEEGRNLLAADETGQADIKNSLLIKTDEGWIEAAPQTQDSKNTYGRREGQLSVASTNNIARELAKKVFQQKEGVEEGATYEIIPTPSAVPLVDFFVGDWVLAPSRAVLVKRRIVSLAVGEDSASGRVVYATEFDTIFQSREQQIERWSNLAAGGGLSSGFSNGGSSSGGSSPSKTPMGSPTQALPSPTTITGITSVGKWGSEGNAYTDVTVTWNQVTTTINGDEAVISYYEVFGSMLGGSVRSLTTITGENTSATFGPLKAGAQWTFYVRAVISEARMSALSPGVVHTTLMPFTKMTRPSAPTVTTKLGILSVQWSGIDDIGNGIPPQLSYVYALVATAENGTYTRAGGTISAPGTINISGLTIGTLYWVRLVAVDYLGVETDRSNASSVTLDGIDVDALGAEIKGDIEAAKTAASDALDKANAAASTADSANTAANKATTDAAKASTDAANAAGIANGKGKVLSQTATPLAADQNANTLWIDTTGGANTPKRWNGSAWVAVTDKAATDAAAAAVTAKNAADQAVRDAAAASTKAGLAQTSADSKNKVFYLTTAPAGTDYRVGDTWFDTANGNRISKWDGSKWALVSFGGQAIADDAIGSVQLGKSVNDTIAKGVADAASAQATANSKSRTWPSSTTAPTSGMATNDTWIRFPDGALFRYSGSAWVSVPLATQSYVQSRGLNLVTNGSAFLGDNTNFSGFGYDPSDHPTGAAAMFTSSASSVITDELIPVDPTLTYDLNFSARQLVAGGSPNLYSLIAPYDADQLPISPAMYTQRAGSQTTLAVALNPGDTTVRLTSAAGWNTTTSDTNKYVAIWNYRDQKGYTWPAGVYTRNAYLFSSISGTTVTLAATYTGPVIPAGTAVGNSFSGGSYLYPTSNVPIPFASGWTAFSGRVSGVHNHANGAASLSFPIPTSFVKVGFLPNRGTPPSGSVQGFANIALNEVTVAVAALDAANVAQESANGKNTITYGTSAPTVNGTRAGDVFFVRVAATGVITAQYEWTGAVWQVRTLDNTVIANLDAGKLTAGTIDAARIRANSLSADKITISDFTNLIDDPSFKVPLGQSWIPLLPTYGNAAQIVSTTGGPGNALLLTASSTSTAIRFDNSNKIAVKEGDQFSFGVRAQNGTNASAVVIFSWRNTAGVAVANEVNYIGPTGSTWTDFTWSGTVPANAVEGTISLQMQAASTTGGVYFAKPFIRRKNEGSLIVDGAITADKLAVNSVQARHIIVGDFSNLASGSDFEELTAVPWDMSNTRVTITPSVGHSPTSSLRVAAGSTMISSALATRIDANSGEEWYFELWALRDAAFNGTSGNSKLRVGSQNGTLLTSVNYGAADFPSGTWTKLSVSLKVNALTTKLQVSLNFDHTAGLVYLDDIIIRRKNSGTMIVDGTITSNQMATGTITADSGIIADAAITSAKIANLDAAKITSGFISGTRIAASTITSRQLIIGDFTNLAEDGSFELEPVRQQWPRTGSWAYGTSTTNAHSGAWYVVLNAGASNYATTSLGSDFQVNPDEKYYMEWWQRRAGANQPAGLNFQVLDLTGTTTVAFDLKPLTPPITAADNTWVKYGGVVTIPAGAGWVRPQLKYMASGAMAGAWAFDDVVIRRQTGSTLIEENSISTGKIVANAITTELIKAEAVTAVEIKTGTITANEVNAGSLKTVILTANAVTTDTLAAGAITSKHTITGALIRTSPSGERTEMSSSGLRVINSSNQDVVRLGFGIDTGMSIRNPYTGALVALAPLVLGMQAWRFVWDYTFNTNGANNGWGPWNAPRNPNSGVFTTTSPTGRFLTFTQVTAARDTQQNYQLNMQIAFYSPAPTPAWNGNMVTSGAPCYASGEYAYMGFQTLELNADVTYHVRGIVRGQSNFGGGSTATLTSMQLVSIPI